MIQRFSVLIFFVIVSVMGAQAQSEVAPVTVANPGGIYIKGGVNFSNISTHNDGSYNDANMLTTYNVGVVADFPLMEVLSVQPGLVFTGKGSKASGSVLGVSSTTKFNPMYIEVPVNFVVKVPIGNDARFFFGAGPYAALGVGGKWKNTTSVGGSNADSDRNIKFGNSSSDDVKALDYGVNGLAGVEVSRLMLNVNYGLGLNKIFPGQTNNSANNKNMYRVLSLNLGVRL